MSASCMRHVDCPYIAAWTLACPGPVLTTGAVTLSGHMARHPIPNSRRSDTSEEKS